MSEKGALSCLHVMKDFSRCQQPRQILKQSSYQHLCRKSQTKSLREIPLQADENSSLKDSLNRCQGARSQSLGEGGGGRKPYQMSPASEESSFPSALSPLKLQKRGGEGLGPAASWQQRLGAYIPSSSINNQPVSIALISLSQLIFFLLLI